MIVSLWRLDQIKNEETTIWNERREARKVERRAESIHVMRLFRKKKERIKRKTESDTDKTHTCEKT